jgi:hypothetical protein
MHSNMPRVVVFLSNYFLANVCDADVVVDNGTHMINKIIVLKNIRGR